MEEFKGLARLPKFAIPKRYDLFLKPDLRACKFEGFVKIDIEIKEQTKFLVLNAADLVVKENTVSLVVSSQSHQKINPSEVKFFEEDEVLVLGFDGVLSVGNVVLSIGFDGTLNDQMKGFYRSTYVLNGEKKNMGVTQFEPTDARRCFPCWDEPALKATFKITVEAPSEVMVLSNMPISDEKIDGQLKTFGFEESPIMSTYLVAVVVGVFDYIEDVTPDGVKVRVYCQVGKTDQGKFALGVAVKTLDLYTKYFSAPYSLPKLDMIAIPDFAAGAMENYGLVTYRDTDLLYDEKHSAAANKQRVAEVVAHELAHQWFGNLVTMEWWTHLWLNEGFATWVSFLASDALFPDWKVWEKFLDTINQGLTLDALAESHPIEVEINHAQEVDEIFDAISYNKGASLIRMLQNYLGAETFQRSLASYIKKYACMNAATDDLWAALSEGSGQPVNELMNTWTKQKGYPVIDVKIKDDRFEFEQSQFLSNGAVGDGKWIVPITLCYGSYGTCKSFLLEKESICMDEKEILPAAGSKQENRLWVKLNVEQTGFYRVKYDDELSSRLRAAIESKSLSPIDRFGILDDSFALCRARKQSLSSLLFLMEAYKDELDYTVLSCLLNVSLKVAKLASDAIPKAYDDLKVFLISLFRFPAEKLGWAPKPSDSHSDAMLRGELLTALALLGDQTTLHEASKRFNAFLDDRDTPLLPPDTRRAAYVAVMQTVSTSNRLGFESLLRIYRETDLSQEKTRILRSLACCPDPSIVLEALNFLLTPEVRKQDAVHGLSGISRAGREVAWEWLKEKWVIIAETYGSGFLITRFISAISSQFSSDEKALEIEAFFTSHMKPFFERTVKQSLERVRVDAAWVRSAGDEESLELVIKELSSRTSS